METAISATAIWPSLQIGFYNFLAFAKTLDLPEVVARGQIKVLLSMVDDWQHCIADSFLSMEMKEDFLELIENRVERIKN